MLILGLTFIEDIAVDRFLGYRYINKIFGI